MKKNKKFDEILNKIPEPKRYIGENLVKELIFIDDTLTELKKQIKSEGVLEHFQQGKQDFQRESPALKAYNTTVQRYSVMYRQLNDLMGKTSELEKDNEVYNFLKDI